MGFLDKFKKRAKEWNVKKSVFDCEIPINKSSYFEVFSACLGKVLANQSACSEIVVKGQNWNVDFPKGILSFGKNAYPLQFIGSESSSSNTWLWGWANKSQLPESVLVEANRLRQLGEAYGLEALVVPQFELTESFNGHNLSIICSALNENNVCYYRGPHQGGAIFVEFSGIPEEVYKPVASNTFVSIALQAIQQFTVHHRIFITSFLFQNATPYEWCGNNLTAHFLDGQSLNVSFEKVDDFWRISNIAGSN